jgi:dihydrodipicolinate synthase/N-acetylneuraminate lyase
VKRISPTAMCGVWSATPTPFTDKMEIDIPSVKRMVEHQVRLGIKGLFLAGTCGEGPWMPDHDRRLLTQAVAKYNRGRMLVAVQVTDNSAARILDNAANAAEDGADIAVIAPPFFHGNPAPDVLLRLYRKAIRESPLPVGIYDRGRFSSVEIPNARLNQIYAESKVVLVKDSSMQPDRMRIALAARRKRPRLRLLNGYEFGCVPYLTAGYDGLLLGGGIFHGYLARLMMEAVAGGDTALAERIQQRMNRMMYEVFGGKKLKCWLSGQKRLLVEMGIFSTWRSYLEYPLTDGCVRAIKRVVKREADVLFP